MNPTGLRQRTLHHGGGPDEAVWEAAKAIAFAASEDGAIPAACQQVMDAIAEMVEADFASIITMRPGLDWVVRGCVGGAEEHDLFASSYSRYCMEMTSTELSRLAGGFQLAQTLFSVRRRERLSIFREFLVPRGLKQVVCAAWVVDTRAWVVGLTRTGPRFPTRALERLTALAPHLAAAFRALSWQPQSAAAADGSGRQDDRRASGGPWALTRAQARVADLAVRGLTNKEIGMLLGTSQNTVRNTLVEVFHKAGVSRRAELAFLMTRCAGDEHPRTSVEALARQQALLNLWRTNASAAPTRLPQRAPVAATKSFVLGRRPRSAATPLTTSPLSRAP